MGTVQLVFVIGVVALAVFFSAALKPDGNSRGGFNSASATPPEISVSVTTPPRTPYTPSVRLNGIVAAQTQTNIIPQVGGRVVRVSDKFKQGATVNKGELLFEIDPSDFLLGVEQAQANISAARSDLKVLEAEAKVARNEWNDIYPEREISELGARIPQMAAAQARLDGAIAAKKTAELALNRTKVTAPEKARVLSTTLSVGQIISPNQSVGQVFSIGNIEISTPLSTSELANISPAIGREAHLIIGGGSGQIASGKVDRIDAILDPRTRLANIFIKPEQADILTIGSFVDVVIQGGEIENTRRLPVSALAERNRVWVIDNGYLVYRRVDRLGEQNSSIIVRDFDIADGVLTLPPSEAFEGQKAKIRPQAEGVR